MSGSFEKLKRDIRKRAFVEALILGGLASLLLMGGIVLCLKLLKVAVPWYWYLIVLGIGFVLGFCGYLLKVMPTEKRIAEKLDREHNLGERAQTLVEFKGKESDILTLQRQDAEEHISRIEYKKPSKTQFIGTIIAAALAFSVAMVGLIYPPYTVAEPIPDGDKIAEIKEEQINALKKIIENIENDAELKSVDPEIEGDGVTVARAFVNELNSLLTGLEIEMTVNQLNAKVTAVMTNIIQDTREKTSFAVIAKELGATEGGEFMANALNAAAKAYDDGERVEYSRLKELAGATLDGAVSTELQQASEHIYSAASKESITESKQGLNVCYSAINGAFSKIGIDKVSADDELYKAFQPLIRDLNALSSVSDSTQVEAVLNSLQNTVLPSFLEDGGAAMYKQSYICLARDYVLDGLSEIFGVAIPEIPDEESDEGSSGGDDGGNTGAGGDMNQLWPGNDKIFDPNDKTYVHYGQLLIDGGKLGQITELAEGEDVPDEIEKLVKEYLNQIKNSPEE